jgi:predicted DNA-binding protein with PD1-like motif
LNEKNLFVIFLTFSCTTTFAEDIHTSGVIAHVLRLGTDVDPKTALTDYMNKNKISSASIVSAVGSLKKTALRYANEKEIKVLEGFREIVSLSGTLGPTGSHLHLSVSDAQGQTLGGHLGEGSRVYTTLEIVLLTYPDLEFHRELDKKTTFQELTVKKKTVKP